jgi:leader peptidase (prepilin peptidase) / N-methyltransferase
MDSTVPVVAGALVAGLGGLLVPRLIARIPEVEPDDAPAGVASGPVSDRERDVDVTVTEQPARATQPTQAVEDPPEPFADIARLPGLAWRSAVVAAVAGAVLGGSLGAHWAWLMWVPLVPAYVALALVDWRTRLLPTFVIAPLYGVLVALALVGWAVTRDTDALVHAVLGWLVYGGLFAVLWFIYPRGLGYGDVRLGGLLGIALGWLGWGAVLIGMYSGLLLGGLLGLVLAMLKVVDRRNNPFGPYMLVGAVIGVLWGEAMWSSLVGG